MDYPQEVPAKDIVVLGGSAGSLEALSEVVRSFPEDMRASVFVVTHLSPRQRSYLASILDRIGPLPAHQVADGDHFVPGHIYVATPDYHLTFVDDHVHLTRGPREGLQRPSINVSFRSAATVFGPRVIGVVLSGMLDDGAAGLVEISRRGGITIVQDPKEAYFPSMPENALLDDDVMYKLKAAEIGAMVGRLVSGEVEPIQLADPPDPKDTEQFSGFTCPECHGPLYTHDVERPVEFRCRVGHVISLRTLIEESGSTQERKLYEAILALEEGADLAHVAAERASGAEEQEFLHEARQLKEYSSAIRAMIESRKTPKLS